VLFNGSLDSWTFMGVLLSPNHAIQVDGGGGFEGRKHFQSQCSIGPAAVALSADSVSRALGKQM
jgi:hypothetical protein